MAYKTNERDMLIVKPIETATGGAQSADVDLAPGLWTIGLMVSSNVTGTTTTVGLYALDDAGGEADVPYQLAEPDDTGAANTITVTGGGAAHEQIMHTVGVRGTVPVSTPVIVPQGGVRIKVVNGTAVNGEKLEISLIAVRRG